MSGLIGNSASVHQKSSDVMELPGFSNYESKSL